MKALLSFRMLGTVCPTRLCHILEDMNLEVSIWTDSDTGDCTGSDTGDRKR
jgi:hypothetical protein